MEKKSDVSSSRSLRAISLLIGSAGVSAMAWVQGYPWLAFVLAITLIGWIYPFFQPPRKKVLTSTTRQWTVTGVVVLLGGLGIGGIIRGDDESLMWLTIPAFIVAWLDYMMWWSEVRDAQKSSHS